MKVLLVAKHSKYEWERKSLNLTHNELIAKYSKERANLDAIMNAYEYQLKVRESFKEVFDDVDFCMMHEVTQDIKGYDLVMALGGDNSFTNISHFVGDTPILGINSDPQRSTGCLTRWAINIEQDVPYLAESLSGGFDIEKWPRLNAVVDGKSITPATSEYFLGETKRNYMSRHVLEYRGYSYEQKCSGIIIATGAGTHGWYASATDEAPLPATNEQCALAITELYTSSPIFLSGRFVDIRPGETVTLHSLNDDEGIVSVDSWDEVPFLRGSTAEITIGKPLNVVTLRDEDEDE